MQVNKINTSPSFGLIMPPVYIEKAPEFVPAIIQRASVQKLIPAKKTLVTSDFIQSQMPNWFKNKEAIVADTKIKIVNAGEKTKNIDTPKECRNTGRINMDRRVSY